MKKKIKVIVFMVSIIILGELSPAIIATAATNDVLNSEQVFNEAIEANEGNEETKTQVNELQVGKNAYTDEADATITLPTSADSPIKVTDLENQESNYTVQLPSEFEGNANIEGDIAIYNSDSATELGLQNTEQGFRALIKIDNETANHGYTFTFNLEEGQKLVTAAEYLGSEYDTGEVYIVDRDNIITSIIDPAWAKDANGGTIQTSYIVDGNKLTQTVEFDSNSAFPIVADPSAWKVTKCAAAISFAVGSTIFAAAKLVKIKKYIKTLGGIKITAKLLVGATTTAERLKVGGSALVGIAAVIFGVDDIRTYCR
ncbi:MAG: hypothetical protein WAS52_06070 [Enterococcus aquimarinus]